MQTSTPRYNRVPSDTGHLITNSLSHNTSSFFARRCFNVLSSAKILQFQTIRTSPYSLLICSGIHHHFYDIRQPTACLCQPCIRVHTRIAFIRQRSMTTVITHRRKVSDSKVFPCITQQGDMLACISCQWEREIPRHTAGVLCREAHCCRDNLAWC